MPWWSRQRFTHKSRVCGKLVLFDRCIHLTRKPLKFYTKWKLAKQGDTAGQNYELLTSSSSSAVASSSEQTVDFPNHGWGNRLEKMRLSFRVQWIWNRINNNTVLSLPDVFFNSIQKRKGVLQVDCVKCKHWSKNAILLLRNTKE